MQIKKLLATAICLFLFMPSLARTTSASHVYDACYNSGIVGYYNSISDTVFKMVNVVVQDFMDLSQAGQPQKKEAPAAENKSEAGKAILSEKTSQKTLKSTLVLSTQGSSAINKDINLSNLNGNSLAVSSGWMTLFILMVLLSVRKKDDNDVSMNYSVNKHPVYA